MATYNNVITNVSGSVGIGTTNPTSRLLIWGNSSLLSEPIATFRANGLQTGGAGVLDVQNSSGSPVLFVSGSGFVGIGTNTRFASDDLQIGSLAGSGNRSLFLSDAGTGLRINAGSGGAFIQSRGVTVALQFLAGNSNDGNYLFTSTGNFGIGAGTNLTAKLLVTGSGTSTGATAHFVNSSGTSLLFARDDGNVGIGSTSPGSQLTVSKNLTNGSVYTIVAIDGQTFGSTVNGNGLVTAYINQNTTWGAVGGYSNGTAGLGLWANTATGVPNVYVNSSGNVGIGTTTVGAKLDVNGSAVATLVGGGRTVPSYSQFEPVMSGTDPTFGSNYAYFGMHRAGNISWQLGLLGDTFVIAHGGGASQYTLWSNRRFSIDTSGNIGIGITNATNILTINKGNGTGLNIQYDNSSNARTGLFLFTRGSSIGGFSGGSEWNDSTATARSTAASTMLATAGTLLFYTDTSLTSGNTFTPSERMRIDTSGNVGINMTPSYTLDVTGISGGNPARFISSNSNAAPSLNAETGIILRNTNSTVGNYSSITNRDANNNANAQINLINVDHTGNSAINFVTRVAGVGFGERARFNSAGHFVPGADSTFDLGASGTRWRNLFATTVSGTIAPTNATVGSVFFAGTSGQIQQDNANFFWDDTNNRLGIGVTNPSSALHVSGSATTSTPTMLVKEGVASPTAGALAFEVEKSNGATLFAVSGSGFVGVGTAVPTATFEVVGVSGSLFSVTDNLSGSLFSVNTISGLPILEVFSDNTLIAGAYNSNALVVTGSRVGVGVRSPTSVFDVTGSSTTTIPTATIRAGVPSQTGAVLDVQTNLGTRLLVVSSSGAVGVGTANPGSQFDVWNLSGNTQSRIVSSATAGLTFIGGSGTHGGTISIDTSSNEFIVGSTSSHPMSIFSANARAVTIGTDGRVGIGSSGSTSGLSNVKLFVSGTSAFSGSLIPTVSNTHDLGTDINRWRALYAQNVFGVIAPTGFSAGSIIFTDSSSILTQNNSSLFWNNTSNRMGIGTNGTLNAVLTVSSSISQSIDIQVGRVYQVNNNNTGSINFVSPPGVGDRGTHDYGAIIVKGNSPSGVNDGGSAVFDLKVGGASTRPTDLGVFMRAEAISGASNGPDIVSLYSRGVRGLVVSGSSAYVGIGTTTNINNRISIYDSAPDQVYVRGTSTNRAGIIIDNSAGYQDHILFRDNGSDKWQLGKQTDNTFFLYNPVDLTSAITINTTNKIFMSGSLITNGTSGNYRLTVYGPMRLSYSTNIVNAKEYQIGSGYELDGTLHSSGGYVMYHRWGDNGDGSGGWKMIFGTPTNSTLTMVNQTVGIGVSNPSSKLHVSGGDIQFETGYGIVGGTNTSGYVLRGNNSRFVPAQLQYSDLGNAPTISGNSNYVARFTGPTTLGNSVIQDDGTRVGVGTTGTSTRMSVYGTSTGTDTTLLVRHNVANGANLPVLDVQNSAGTSLLFVSGSGNVGIGITNPASKFVVQSNTQYDGIFLRNSSYSAVARLIGSTVSNDGGILALSYAGSDTAIINGNGDSYLNAGKLGIGTNNPIELLNLGSNSSLFIQGNSNSWGYKINVTDAGGGDVPIRFVRRNNGTDTESMRIDQSGRVGIGTSTMNTTLNVFNSTTNGTAGVEVKTPPVGAFTSEGKFSLRDVSNNELGKFYLRSGDAGRTNVTLLSAVGSTNALGFETNDTRAVTIDTSQRVGIGRTNPSFKLDVSGSSGDGIINASAAYALGGTSVIYSTSNDVYGNFRVLQNQSSTLQDGMYINYNSTGTSDLRFFAGTGGGTSTTTRMWIQGSTGHTLPGADNTYDLGTTAVRWRNLYLSNTLSAPSLAATGLTQGSVVFAGSGGTLSGDVNNLYWDNTGKNLGIGTSTVTKKLTVAGDALINSVLVGRGGTGAGADNTALGQSASNSLTTGGANTSVGNAANFYNNASNNTAIGYSSQYTNTNGISNTSLGVQSLYTNSGIAGQNNVAIGMNALYFSTGYGDNTAVGYESIKNGSRAGRTAVGYRSLYNGGPSYSTAVGYNAMYSAGTSATNCVAVGAYALETNTTGTDNTAIGISAMTKCTGFSRNTAVGAEAIGSGPNSYENTAVGYRALLIGDGQGNVAVGAYALDDKTTSFNTAVGWSALGNTGGGGDNTAIGYSAGSSISAGSRNLVLGYSSGTGLTDGNYNVVLGSYQAGTPFATQSNNIFISDGQANLRMLITGSNGGVGIGTTSWNGLISVLGDTPRFVSSTVSNANYTVLQAENQGCSLLVMGKNPSVSTPITASFGTYSDGASSIPRLLLWSTRDIAFATSWNTPSVSAVIFDLTGSVGIGTEVPRAKLDVNGKTRLRDDVGIDAGKYLYLGREESFGGSDTGGSDYGYLRWDNDNNDYDFWSGGSAENGALIIGSENDSNNGNSDVVVLKGKAANIFDSYSGLNLFVGPDGGNSSSGNTVKVGIGTTNPTATLSVMCGATQARINQVYTDYAGIFLNGSTTDNHYNFLSNASGSDKNLYINRPDGWDIRFRKDNVDQVTITSAGYLGVGTTGPVDTLDVRGGFQSEAIYPRVNNVYNIGYYNFFIGYMAYNTIYGYQYPNLSDYRTKKNIQEVKGSLEKISKLRPITYEYNGTVGGTENLGTRIGFLAHEVQEQFPLLVTGEKDDVDEESGKIKLQMIMQDDLIPYAVDAIRELKLENDSLKSEIQSLKEQISSILAVLSNK